MHFVFLNIYSFCLFRAVLAALFCAMEGLRVVKGWLTRGVNRRTDRRILQIFLPGFRIQSEILTDFRILQLQRNADSSIFWSRILDSACNINIFARISDS